MISLYGVESKGVRIYYNGEFRSFDDYDPSSGQYSSNPCPINPSGSLFSFGNVGLGAGVGVGGYSLEKFVGVAAQIVDKGDSDYAKEFCKKYYQYDDGAWCADFVCACAKYAGLIDAGVISPSAGCYGLAEQTVKNCKGTYLKGPAQSGQPDIPQRGDLAFFTWDSYSGSGGLYGASHVEIVESFESGSYPKLVTLGGNGLGRDTYTKDGGYYGNLRNVHHYVRPNWIVSNYATLGPTVSRNGYLNENEQKVNAWHIWKYFESLGWSMEAVAGMLGNFQVESTINPGIWQGLKAVTSLGFGLAQWTPSTTYTVDWFQKNGYGKSTDYNSFSQMDYQLAFIEWESNRKDYDRFAGSGVGMTFNEYKTKSKTNGGFSAYDLAVVFLHGYERPANPNQDESRGSKATAWFNFLKSGGIN